MPMHLYSLSQLYAVSGPLQPQSRAATTRTEQHADRVMTSITPYLGRSSPLLMGCRLVLSHRYIHTKAVIASSANRNHTTARAEALPSPAAAPPAVPSRFLQLCTTLHLCPRRRLTGISARAGPTVTVHARCRSRRRRSRVAIHWIRQWRCGGSCRTGERRVPATATVVGPLRILWHTLCPCAVPRGRWRGGHRRADSGASGVLHHHPHRWTRSRRRLLGLQHRARAVAVVDGDGRRCSRRRWR